MTNSYYAQPYNIEAVGFYFTDYEEYQARSKGLTDRFGQLVEEFEIEFIDGDTLTSKLFNELEIRQGSLEEWFEKFEGMESCKLLAACYLAWNGHFFGEILDAPLEDFSFLECTPEDYARDYIDSSGLLADMPESLHSYLDYKAFGRDLVLNGNITEWKSPDGIQYVVIEPLSW